LNFKHLSNKTDAAREPQGEIEESVLYRGFAIDLC